VSDEGQRDRSPLPFGPGDVVAGRYKLEEPIGAGGMSAVVAATHLLLDERVALKFVIGDSTRTPGATERLLREARVTARLSSEHVVRVLDAGIATSGHLFIAMELLHGEDLRKLLDRRGRLQFETAVEYTLGACDALSDAHALGVVHRDVKPSNLYVSRRPRDGRETIKVLDFGVSKVSAPASTTRDLTGSKVVGSPCYMAPEQFSASAAVDGRADVWSLAAVLFECLAGTPPYRARTLGEYGVVLGAAEGPPPLRALRDDVPKSLDDVLARALAMDPAERTGSIDEFARDLAAVLPRRHRARERWLEPGAGSESRRARRRERARARGDSSTTRMTARSQVLQALSAGPRRRLMLLFAALFAALAAVAAFHKFR
jgi:serine/threonine-protein kinase